MAGIGFLPVQLTAPQCQHITRHASVHQRLRYVSLKPLIPAESHSVPAGFVTFP